MVRDGLRSLKIRPPCRLILNPVRIDMRYNSGLQDIPVGFILNEPFYLAALTHGIWGLIPTLAHGFLKQSTMFFEYTDTMVACGLTIWPIVL